VSATELRTIAGASTPPNDTTLRYTARLPGALSSFGVKSLSHSPQRIGPAANVPMETRTRRTQRHVDGDIPGGRAAGDGCVLAGASKIA
jgi:hypothetical protein